MRIRASAQRNEADAHRNFHRHEIGYRALSPEEKTLNWTEEEGSQESAEAELDALAASVAGHAVAGDVLRCRRETA